MKIEDVLFIVGFLLILFVLIPIGNMLYSQLFDIQDLVVAFKDRSVIKAIAITLIATTVSTVIALIFGVPLAYSLARREFLFKSVIESIVDTPLVLPHIVAGIALYGVLMKNGIIGAPLEKIGVLFIDAFPGIVAAMLFVSFPFLVDTAKEGFRKVDKRVENVARSLGASEIEVFREVSLPLASNSIFAGAIQCWARGIGEFAAIMVVATFPTSATILIGDRFTTYGLSGVGNIAGARAISILLMFISLTVFVILRRLERVV